MSTIDKLINGENQPNKERKAMSLEPSKVYSDGGTCVYFVLSVLNGIVYSICYSRKTKKYSVGFNPTTFFTEDYKEVPTEEHLFQSLQVNRDGALYDVMAK